MLGCYVVVNDLPGVIVSAAFCCLDQRAAGKNTMLGVSGLELMFGKQRVVVETA